MSVLDQLIALLNVELKDEKDVFFGQSEDLGFKSVFGGQVLGQALMAAYRTVENRYAHSLHAYFLRPGNAFKPIRYQVHRIRDGGSFTTRRVLAIQDDEEILTMVASFQVEESGFEHQTTMPEVEGPEGLFSELEMRRMAKHEIPESVREQAVKDRPIEVRPVNPLNYFDPEIRSPAKRQWFRAIDSLPDDVALNQCLLAYASDFGLLGTSMLPHGVTFYSNGMQVASLDHSIWFQRPFKLDEWLLYDMESPSAESGRGFNLGKIYTEDGVLVACTSQEALIRKRR